MSNRTSRPSLYQAIIVVCFALVITPPTCQAQLFYDFIEGDTGEVMATLELATLPATSSDVDGLTFPAGFLFDEFGPTYLGDFDAFTGGGVAETLPNNLGCLACSDGIAQITDTRPPEVLVNGFFTLIFSNMIGEDRMFFVSQVNLILVNGDWLKVVPEPTTVSYLIAAVLFGVGSARRRKRQV